MILRDVTPKISARVACQLSQRCLEAELGRAWKLSLVVPFHNFVAPQLLSK
jgi:hypothetical protein